MTCIQVLEILCYWNVVWYLVLAKFGMYLRFISRNVGEDLSDNRECRVHNEGCQVYYGENQRQTRYTLRQVCRWRYTGAILLFEVYLLPALFVILGVDI
jgi:hypothetical protein